jgi:hypothetical protein
MANPTAGAQTDRYAGLLRRAEGGKYKTRYGGVVVRIDAGKVTVDATQPGRLVAVCEDGSELVLAWQKGTLDLPAERMPDAYHLWCDLLEKLKP